MAHQILIVENQIEDSEHVDAALTSFGYEVAGRATNQSEALQLAKETGSDLAVLNMDLGTHEEGFAIARELREQVHIPVIFISQYSSLAIMRRAAASGCFGYLSKPFRLSELDATIRIALHQHSIILRTFSRHSWLTSVFDSLSDGVIATSEDGIVRFLNPAAQVLTGWMPVDAIGKPVEDIYPLFDSDGVNKSGENQIRRVLATRSPTGKQRFLLASQFGARLPIEDSASPILEGDTLIGAVTIFNNISARIVTERVVQMEVGQLRADIEVSHLALAHSKDELQTLAERLINAQEEERRRIGRELHDDLAQRAALILQRLDQITSASKTQADDKQPDLESFKTMISELSDGIRNVSHRLHPAVVEDLGLPQALGSLVSDYRKLGLDVCVEVRNAPNTLPLPVATALYRIAQEALHNTLRHAPGAPAKISLFATDRECHLCITDAGPGFSLADATGTSGLGLLSMQERARMAGGELLVKTDPGNGTSISATVPVISSDGPKKDSPR